LGVPHRALKDVQIGKYSIEKGSTVSGSLYHAMRDKRFFENPEIFNPQRFLDKGIVLNFYFFHSQLDFKLVDYYRNLAETFHNVGECKTVLYFD
jgi:cytochrome P450